MMPPLLEKPASWRNWGIWVVLPLPVSPTTMSTGEDLIAWMSLSLADHIGSFLRSSSRSEGTFGVGSAEGGDEIW